MLSRDSVATSWHLFAVELEEAVAGRGLGLGLGLGLMQGEDVVEAVKKRSLGECIGDIGNTGPRSKESES
jgi:hypothetical protein